MFIYLFIYFGGRGGEAEAKILLQIARLLPMPSSKALHVGITLKMAKLPQEPHMMHTLLQPLPTVLPKQPKDLPIQAEVTTAKAPTHLKVQRVPILSVPDPVFARRVLIQKP